MLDKLFMSILDLTKTGSIVILAVIAVRFFLKKAPKVISYALWAVVLFRLLCPVTLELPVSMMPKIQPVKESYSLADTQLSFVEAGAAAYQAVDNAITGIPGVSTQMVPIVMPDTGGNPTYVSLEWTDLLVIFGQYVWLLGVAPQIGELWAVMASYPITWALTSVLFVVYYLRGNWLRRARKRAGHELA